MLMLRTPAKATRLPPDFCCRVWRRSASCLLVHRGRSGKVPRDDGLGAQHDKQMPECRAQIAVVPPSRRRILTLEQMVIEKSLDGVLVNPIDVQPRPAPPKRKHCKACHVYIDGARCV